jgi:hypothetical protein
MFWNFKLSFVVDILAFFDLATFKAILWKIWCFFLSSGHTGYCFWKRKKFWEKKFDMNSIFNLLFVESKKKIQPLQIRYLRFDFINFRHFYNKNFVYYEISYHFVSFTTEICHCTNIANTYSRYNQFCFVMNWKNVIKKRRVKSFANILSIWGCIYNTLFSL